MVGGIYCVNMNKIKKAAKILRKAAPSFPPSIHYCAELASKHIKICYKKNWYDIKIVETDLIPYQVEAATFVDGNDIIIIMVKDYEKYYGEHRKRWTLVHELSHICLGHVFVPESLLTNRVRWFFDKEANKLTREVLLPKHDLESFLFEGMNLTPVRKSFMARTFGVSFDAMKNALREYGITESNNNHLCLFFPGQFECVSINARKRCVTKKLPHKECRFKIFDNNLDVTISLKDWF